MSPTNLGTRSAPAITVVIPTFSRPAALARCLAALSRQTVQRPFEVIVINDGGPAITVESCFADRFTRFLVLHQDHAGPAAARNLGSAQAAGDFLAFTDDDCEPSPDWLSELDRRLRAEPSAMVGGHTVNALRGNPCAQASQALIDFLYAYYREGDSPRFFTSNNLALAREAFNKIGRFDDGFPLPAAEDRDLCARWQASGHPGVYASEAVVYHSHEMSFWKFLRQHYRYGRGAWLFRKRRKEQGTAQPRLEPVEFYVRMLAYPFRVGEGSLPGKCVQTGLIFISQAVHTLGFFREKWSGRELRAPAHARTQAASKD